MSRSIDLSENEFIERFVGQDHIDSNDAEFWYQLLMRSFDFTRVHDPKVVDKTLDPYLVRLTLNNSQSLNIGSLIRVFFDRVARIRPDGQKTCVPYYVSGTFNALYLIKLICKSYIENTGEEQLIKALKAQVNEPSRNVAQAHQVQHSTAPSPLTSSPPMPTNEFLKSEVQSQANHGQIHQQQNQQQETQSLNSGTAPNQTSDVIIGNIGNHSVSQDQCNGSQATNHTPSVPVSQAPSNNVKDTSTKSEVTSGLTILDQLISTLVSIIVDIPLTDLTYLLQVESINTIIVLLSIQMFSPPPSGQSVIYKCLMQKRAAIHALVLTKTLMTNFIQQKPMPEEPGSIIIGLASGLWRMLTLGYGASNPEEQVQPMPLLARQSLLLLNVLTYQYSNEKNPYREAIVSCQDSRFNLSDPAISFDSAQNDKLATAVTSKSALESNSIKVDFGELYETICKNSNNDQVALLLYLLLHNNKIFRPYIFTTALKELDKLVLPMLKVLYSSIEMGSHHVYMILILFIILSEEPVFNEATNEIIVQGVPWYKDRPLGEISLGSLTALIIIKSFQFNTFRIRDKFIHANLYAILVNLSSHFHHLHPYVCQRLVELLERLSKKYLAATKQLSFKKGSLHPNSRTLEVLSEDNPLARALATDTEKQRLQDASSFELDSTLISQNMDNQNGININLVTNELQQGQQINNPPLQPMQAQSQLVPTSQERNDAPNLVSAPVDSYNSDYPASETSSVNIPMDDKQDLSLIEEVTRMILTIIDNCLGTQLGNNPDLVYTLLYKRTVFSSLLSSHQSFYYLALNIEKVLTFFYNKIESEERSLSIDEIKSIIQVSSSEWTLKTPRDNSPNLIFHYVEDEQPEEFFIPYIWTRIYYSSGLVWNSKRIKLFHPDFA